MTCAPNALPGIIAASAGGLGVVGRVLDADGAEAFYWGDGNVSVGYAAHDLVDRTGNGYTLVDQGDAGVRYTRCTAIPANAADGYNGGAYYFRGTTGATTSGMYHDDSVAGGLRSVDTVTIQMLARHTEVAGDLGKAVQYGGNGTAGTTQSNVLYGLIQKDYEGGSNDFPTKVEMYWQNGTNNTISFATVTPDYFGQNVEWQLITAVRWDEGATVGVELYANEKLLGSTTGLAKPTGGEDQILSIGRVYNYGAGAPWYYGALGQIRIWHARRTPAEIAADVARVLPLQVQP